mmetsp:Transcript_2754/g.3012  ORF Transcript_2754/g.3012 Transcript_2754/m.3012 type:complete len:453 (+) Transcript_2754:234-1592(+)
MVQQLGQDDIVRMQSSVAVVKGNYDEKRERLKRLSDDRVSRWTDTLKSKRKARLEWKEMNQNRIELERQALDKDEFELQTRNSISTVQKANRLVYEQNENVRRLRSDQFYTDVMAEREEQIAVKRKSQAQLIKEEQKWHDDAMARNRKEEKRAQDEVKAKKAKAVEFAEAMKQQKLEKELQRQKVHDEVKREEAKKIEKATFNDLESAKRDFLGKLERKQRSKQEMERMKLAIQESRGEMDLREKEDFAKRQRELDERNQLIVARRDLERKHIEKRTKQKLDGTANADLERRSKNELDQFLKETSKREARQIQKDAEATKVRIESDRAVDESRQNQIKQKREAKQRDMIEEKRIADHMKQINEEMQEKGQKKTKEKKKKDREFCKLQGNQAAADRKRREEGKSAELQWQQQRLQNFALEDSQFEDFAQKEIARFQALGKNTKIMEGGICRKN